MQSSRRLTEATLAATPQRERTHFLVSLLAVTIQELVGFRSGTTSAATTTRVSVPVHCSPTPETRTQRPAQRHSLVTLPVSVTRPMERSRYFITMRRTIPRLVTQRFLPTPPAPVTRLSVTSQSLPTTLAPTTPRWVMVRSPPTPPLMTTRP